jgi:hypothetical protein
VMRSFVIGALALAALTAVRADEFPSRTVTIVSPYQAGGTSDIIVCSAACRPAARQHRKVRQRARHVPDEVIQVKDIPRSLNGKPSEIAVPDTVHGRGVKNLLGLQNPEALEFFRDLPQLRLA